MTVPLRSSRRTARQYNPISSERQGANDDANPRSSTNTNTVEEEDYASHPTTSTSLLSFQKQPSTLSPPLPSICPEIKITILDSAQTKFSISAYPSWTVHQFKLAGSAVHKVPLQSQRLIYMGKLLQDASTLSESGLGESGLNGAEARIVHLFPKPNIQVVTGTSTSTTSTDALDQENRDNEEGSTNRRAHIPQILLNEEEASRRSQVLIFSSHEIFEAQHRVKLLSFLLLIVCSMELLKLFTIMVGVPPDGSDGYSGFGDDVPSGPGDPTDTAISGSTDQTESWQNSDYADLVISALGFYVATLGIKASTENTVALARQYFVLLIITGVASNAYYYYLSIQNEKKEYKGREEDTSSVNLYTQALVGLMLPVLVWCICFLRAWQFRRLMEVAESESLERARSLSDQDVAVSEGNNEHGSSSVGVEIAGERRGSEIIRGGNDTEAGVVFTNDLELQIEGRSIS